MPVKRKKFENENWTYYKINKLTKSAEHYVYGSKNWEQEYKELSTYNRKLARLSNQRLRELKKAGKDYYAYDSAQAFTERAYGTTRFKDKLTEPRDMKMQILAMQRFLNYETSTVEGHLAVEERRRTKFREMFPEMNDMNISDTELNGFLRFLGSAPLRSTIFEAGKVTSGGLVDLIRGQYFSDDADKREEMMKMFERYRLTHESSAIGQSWTTYDLGYDELIEYLKTGEDPTGYFKKGAGNN